MVSYRGAVSSLQEQASNASPVPMIAVDFDLCRPADQPVVPSTPVEPRYHIPEEEIALGACALSQVSYACVFIAPRCTAIRRKFACVLANNSSAEHVENVESIPATQAQRAGCGTT